MGGYQLASGYINRPDQTSAAFLTTPYGRLYRTGDKARLSNGHLECLGRLSDGQVKLRGQRLELGEVEQAILRTSGCHSAVAAVVDSILVAFCAVDAGTLEDNIVQKCKDWLPQFMVPNEIILMKDFPRLPSGKVDRKTLKAEYQARKSDWADGGTDTSPLDELEAKVTGIVSQVLDLQVERSTSLPAAGLDSLKIIKLAATLRENGLDISSAALLNMKSVSEIIFTVRKLPHDRPDQVLRSQISYKSHVAAIVEDHSVLHDMVDMIEDVLPCTPLQSAMLAETANNPSAYCNEVELQAPLDYTAAQISVVFHTLVQHHEILRAGFTTWNGMFMSIIFQHLRHGQIAIVDSFQPTFAMRSSEDYLNPLRIQILERNSNAGPRILVQMHHSIYDGWSFDLLLSDLSRLLQGQGVPNSPSFREVIGFYNNRPSQESDDLAKIFWTEHLQGWTKAPLPKLHPQVCRTDHIRSTQMELNISKKKVQEASDRNGCSPQVFFQASLIILWSGVLGLSDVVIGSVTSGRSIPVAGIEKITGPCIAALPMRINLESLSTSRDLLNNLQFNNRKIMQYCELSLSEVTKLIGLQPGQSFYDVLFAYQESLESQARSNNLIREIRHVDRLETPLLFEVEPAPHEFNLQVTYRAGIFPPDMIEQLTVQFECIVQHLLDDESRDIQSIRRNVLSGPSVNNLAPSLFEGVPDLALGFERMVIKQPNSEALRFAHSLDATTHTASLTYEELNRAANQVGWYLRRVGVEPGEVVAIIMNKSANLYITILGVIKAGCPYLPLLPSTPSARVKDILRQAGVRTCLTDENPLPARLNPRDVAFVPVNPAALGSLPQENLGTLPDPSRPAYVIYTSGTTGVPKGVTVTQLNIVANISHLMSLYPIKPESQPRLLQACSQAFDVSVFEIFFTWHAGMCLCAATNDTLFEDLEHAIRWLSITHLSMTPTVAALVNPKNTPSVEFLVTAGEPLTQAVASRWGDRLWQGYGPSETTNICTVKQMGLDYHVEHLGHALAGTSTFVLFPGSLDLVPLGWVGEFCFGGDQVAEGYLNMPELTMERFIDHPIYGRIYRSGDMGRMLPDGSLVILGRIDDQVKLRGQRIETSEINSIATSTDVAISAVTLLVKRVDVSADQLVLFYVPSPDLDDFRAQDILPNAHQSLLAALQAHLPAYMVPSYLIPVSKIPLTASGKVDRTCLRTCFHGLEQKYLERASSGFQVTGDETPWTNMELSIAEVISSVTEVPRASFSRWTPLALLGIDSISAIELVRQLNKRLEAKVAVSAILQNQTVAQLARFIGDTLESHPEVKVAEFFSTSFMDKVREEFGQESKVVSNILPCTPLQEAMLSRGQRSYINRILLRLSTEPESMRRYWETITQRHEILRTCFMSTNDTKRAIAQVVIDGWRIPWLRFNVTEPSFDGAIHEHLQSLPSIIDSKKPPVSLAFIKYRSSMFLSFICHHALYDGVAMGNIWKEIECLARGEQLPPTVPYDEFLRAALQLPSDVEPFWMAQFREYRSSILFPQPIASEINQSTHTTSLDMPLTEFYKRTRNLGVSLLSVCQASWANVLATAHSRHDVCFGNVVSGRTLDIDGLDRLVAPCFNTLPIRANFSNNSTNLELIKYFQALNNGLIPYQFTPLRLIQRIVNGSGKHLFDTLLLLQQPLQDIDRRVWTLEEDSGDMDIPLVCEIVPCPGVNSLIINIHRNMDTVTEETATAMAEALKLFLKISLHAPHATISNKTALPMELVSILETLEPRHEKVDTYDFCADTSERWSDVETEVREVLVQLARVPASRVHRHTTIFQLGLDSINAVQVASVLRQRGFRISASDVIECPSCLKIAAKLVENSTRKEMQEPGTYDFKLFSQEVSSQLDATLHDRTGVEAILPCTPVQSAMLASFIQSHGENYLNAVSYLVDEGITMQNVSEAWKMLQMRHPMLRTGFIPIDHRDCSFVMVRYDPSHAELPLEIQEDRDDGLLDLKKEVQQGFRNSLGLPPWKVFLVAEGNRFTMNIIIHHALYDAPSLRQMLDGISRLLRGENPRLSPNIEPALSTILRKSGDVKGIDGAFWKSKGANAVVNKFPIMTPLSETTRCVKADKRTSSLSFSELRQATQASSLTVQAVIQAAWTRVLASYLGEESVIFGVALSGRTTDATNDAPFPCLNTVPIVARNMSSNAQLAGFMMEYNQHLHKHQFSPLSQIQKWLGHPTGPIFDTLLAYQKIETRELASTPWELVKEEAMVQYPVSLEIEPSQDDKVNLCITYSLNTLPQEQARLMLDQFDACMAHIARNPDGYEDDLHMESKDLFSILPAHFPTLHTPVQLLHEFVERQAFVSPQKPALEFVSGWKGELPVKQRWTYSELDQLGNKVANIIHEKAPARSIIAIHFDKCPEAYFAILGILKAGCSFVALDPSAPKARKQFIVGDSKSPCLLTKDPDSLDFEVTATVISIDQNRLQKATSENQDWKLEITPSDTCYCLYTSGTTGTPKGCEITHENAVQAMMAFQELFKGHWCESSRWLQFAALHFDVSVLEQYWSWSVGITVMAAPKDLILEDLTATINRLDITHIDLTPSLARLTHPVEVPSLCRGVFITGGEQLKQEILDVWGSKGVIYNAYGPTEATIGVTMYQRVPVNGRPSNIGPQFPNVGSFVFRPGTEVPVFRGGVGELCVSGKLVGKGYLNRPELTQERFPLLDKFGERVYRTGDLVRMLHDGCFDFLGRADDQVKLRGQRLEVAEIDHTIRTGVPEIQDAATIVTRHGQSGKDVLVSFIVGQATSKVPLLILTDTQGLGWKAKEACRAGLPGYMVPTYIFVLPYIPLSPNNKADVKELKRLFGGLSHAELMELTRSAAAPVSQSAQESLGKIIDIVAEFSGFAPENLSSSTSIFDVGVDSITSLRLSSLLKLRGFHAASPSMLLKYPLIADLTHKLIQSTPIKQESRVREVKQIVEAYGHRYRAIACRALGVTPGDIDYIAPCSPLQQGMISRTMTSKERDLYFNSFDMILGSEMSIEKLQAAWANLVGLEAILRTAFVPTSDGFIQVALKEKPPVWSQIVFEEDEASRRHVQKAKENWVEQNKSTICSPLLLIYVETPTCRKLVINIFHAIYDGSSFELMMAKLSSLYNDLPPLSGPSFIEALAHGPLWKYDGCRRFWEHHLQGWKSTPITRLVTPTQVKSVQATRDIPVGRLEAFRALHNVTLQSITVALWASVLQGRLSNPVTIGIILSGRASELPGVSNTIGPLFNTVPFFTGDLEHQTWATLIRRCHDFNSALLEFQHVPLKEIQRWCSNGRALFDTLFSFQIEGHRTMTTSPWTIIDSDTTPDYPLALEATRSGATLRLSLVAQGHIFDATMLEWLLDQFENAMTSLEPARNDSSIEVLVGPDVLLSAQEDPTTEASIEKGGSFQWTEQALILREEISALAKIQVEDVGESVTILELGLDSIDVIKLSVTLKKRAISLSPSRIMSCQTISGIVSELDDSSVINQLETRDIQTFQKMKQRLWNYLETLGLDMEKFVSVLPPTPLQESMVAGMMQSDFSNYFNHDVLRIEEHIDLEKLQRAWEEMIQRSQILRTHFLEIEVGEFEMAYCQVVMKSSDVAIEHVHLSQSADIDRIISKAKQKARDQKGNGGLVQICFATVGEQRYLILSMAHALYDGWSLSLLLQDLQNAYHGRAVERPLPDIFLSKISETQSQEAEDFWCQYLDGASPTLVPALQQSSITGASEVQRQEFSSRFSMSEISAFCKRESISLQVLCQACWALILAQKTQKLDVTFGVVVSGRDFDGAEDLIFPTMNTVALRSVLHGSSSTFLRYLEDNMADIRQYQHFPLRKTQRMAKTQASELFNTLFILQKAFENPSSDSMLQSLQGSSATEYPICIEAEVLGSTLKWRIACRSNYSMDEGGPERILRDLDGIMHFLMTSSSQEILSFEKQSVSICGMPPVQVKQAHGAEAWQDLDAKVEEDEWTVTATVIRDVLSQVAKVPSPSIRLSDTLYHLGLDSISAIKVSSLLRNQRIRLRAHDLVKARSVAHMAEMAHLPDKSEPLLPPGLPSLGRLGGHELDQLLERLGLSSDDVEVLPALPMQVYMLSAWQNAKGAVFFPEFLYTIDASIQLECIQAAWKTLVSESPLLRTCFVATESKDIPILQVILNNHEIPLSQDSAVKGPSQPYWVGASLARQEGQPWSLRLTIHHALYDGVSLPATMNRFSTLLGTTTSRAEDPQLALWRTFTIGQATPQQRSYRKEFWTQYLKDCHPSAEQNAPGSNVGKRTSCLKKSAVPRADRVRALGTQHGISIQSLFFAAYAKAVATQEAGLNENAIVFGIYLANRTTDHALPPTYPTLNLVPLKVEAPGTKPVLQIATQIQKDIQTISSAGLANVGLWEISFWTGVRIQSFVNFLSFPDTPGEPGEVLKQVSPGLPLTDEMDESTLRSTYPLTLKNIVKTDFPVSPWRASMISTTFANGREIAGDRHRGISSRFSARHWRLRLAGAGDA